jgi:hypothetical protein
MKHVEYHVKLFLDEIRSPRQCVSCVPGHTISSNLSYSGNVTKFLLLIARGSRTSDVKLRYEYRQPANLPWLS